MRNTNMEIYANVKQLVYIKPIDVIQKLIDQEIGYGNWIEVINAKYYICGEESVGIHSHEVRKETTQEIYDYIQNLENVKHYLEKNK